MVAPPLGSHTLLTDNLVPCCPGDCTAEGRSHGRLADILLLPPPHLQVAAAPVKGP